MNWDQYFMNLAILASKKSKDPSTKVGAVIVDRDNHIISTGYNGFISNTDESQMTWSRDTSKRLSEQKYAYVVHAEANAIVHATKSLKDSVVYVTLFPCHTCAKLLASAKVREIKYLDDKYEDTESNEVAKKIFKLCNINYQKVLLQES